METLTWQGSLLADDDPGFDPGLDGVRRQELAHGAWVDHLPGWLQGSDRLFAALLDALSWSQRTERIQGRDIPQPRLTCFLPIEDLVDELAVLRSAGETLSRRYAVRFERVGVNLYRDGRDSVAWHGDRVARDMATATIAIVSLGHPRRFRLRPREGGTGLGFDLGRGDLLVMGGTCQRTWKHSVPKVAEAGPRISVTFRHAYPPAPA